MTECCEISIRKGGRNIRQQTELLHGNSCTFHLLLINNLRKKKNDDRKDGNQIFGKKITKKGEYLRKLYFFLILWIPCWAHCISLHLHCAVPHCSRTSRVLSVRSYVQGSAFCTIFQSQNLPLFSLLKSVTCEEKERGRINECDCNIVWNNMTDDRLQYCGIEHNTA